MQRHKKNAAFPKCLDAIDRFSTGMENDVQRNETKRNEIKANANANPNKIGEKN